MMGHGFVKQSWAALYMVVVVEVLEITGEQESRNVCCHFDTDGPWYFWLSLLM